MVVIIGGEPTPARTPGGVWLVGSWWTMVLLPHEVEIVPVKLVVVEHADENSARDVGVPVVVVPPVEVVDLAEPRRGRAAFPRASPVARDDSPALRRCEQPLAASQVERFGLGAHDEPSDLRVAQRAPELGKRQQRPIVIAHRWS